VLFGPYVATPLNAPVQWPKGVGALAGRAYNLEQIGLLPWK
jgi:hypothetical protein